MKNLFNRVAAAFVGLVGLAALPAAQAFDGTEMDAILPIVTALVAGGTAIVIAVGVYQIGARVFKRVTSGT